MTTSIFQFTQSDDAFLPSDMAETPEEFARAVRDERAHDVSQKQQQRLGTYDRNRLIVAMVDEGNTQTEVAQAFGVSRERIRQIYDLNSPKPFTRRNIGQRQALAILAAIRRDPSIDSWEGAERVTAYKLTHTVRRAFAALGVEPALRRLFRLRVRARQRQHVVGAIRAVAERTGRNPRMLDFFAAGAGASVALIYKTFPGGFTEALAAAGLPPNPKGFGTTGVVTLYDRQRIERGQAPVRARTLTRHTDSLD